MVLYISYPVHLSIIYNNNYQGSLTRLLIIAVELPWIDYNTLNTLNIQNGVALGEIETQF